MHLGLAFQLAKYDARVYLVWTLLGIFFSLRSLYSKLKVQYLMKDTPEVGVAVHHGVFLAVLARLHPLLQP